MRAFFTIPGTFLMLALLFDAGNLQPEADGGHPFAAGPPSVKAGPPQTIQLPAGTIRLSGSARSANGRIVSYQWSYVDGPTTPVIESPGRSKTAVSGLIAGTYTFRLSAVDAAGLTGSDTTKLILLPAPVRELICQPSSNPQEALLALWMGDPGPGTDPAPPELCAAAWTKDGSPLLLRSVFRFDLEKVPAGAKIISAQLTLWSNPSPLNGNHRDANSGANNAFFIERITGAWVNPGVDWFSQPSTSSSQRIAIPHTPQAFHDLINLDVTGIVSEMMREGNYGFMIRLQQERAYTIRNFCSSRHADAAKRPRLVITYQP